MREPRIALALRGRILTPRSSGGVELIDDGLILVDEQGRIEAVLPWRQGRARAGIPVRDMRPHVLMPGFVDAHTHYPQTRIIGRATGPLLSWLDESVFPEEARFRRRAHAQRVAGEFIGRLIASGTTTAAVFSSSSAMATEVLFAQMAESGLRAVIGLTLMDQRCPRELRVPRAQAMRDARRLAKRWHGHDGGRLRFAVTPRFAISCSRALLRDAGRLAAELELPIQTHVGETRDECAETLTVHPYADHYMDVYDQAGLLGERTVLAHAIHLAAREWRTVRERGASVAHCPDSNFFLGSGRMKVVYARARGIRVGLGTDVAAGRTFSIRRAMASAYDNALCLGQPLSPEELLTLATLGGADALGVASVIGSLEPHKDADVIAVRCPPDVRGIDEVLAAVVFDTDDLGIEAMWVRGKFLEPMPNGR